MKTSFDAFDIYSFTLIAGLFAALVIL